MVLRPARIGYFTNGCPFNAMHDDAVSRSGEIESLYDWPAL